MLRQLHRRLFMPFFIVFIMIGVALSMGSSSAQSGTYGNFGAEQPGYIYVCNMLTETQCPHVAATSAFRVPSTASFSTLDSFTVALEIDISGTYTYRIRLGQFSTQNPQSPSSGTFGHSLRILFDRQMSDSGSNTGDFTFTRADFPNSAMFVPGEQYAIDVSIADFNGSGFGGWRLANTPPSGIFDYIGTFASSLLTNPPTPRRTLIAQHARFSIEVSPATRLTPTTSAVTEGAASVDATLTLNANPLRAVTVPINADAQCEVSANNVDFSSSVDLQFDVDVRSATFYVRAVDDSSVEGAHSCIITTGTTSPSFGITNLAMPGEQIADLTVNITDNDTLPPPVAGVTITQSSGSTDMTEGGATDTLALRLNSAPTADVTINLATDAQCTAAPATLTFTSRNYAADQTVTLTAIDDAAVETTPHPCAISFTAISSDGDYNGLSVPGVTANVTDAGASMSMPRYVFTQTDGSTIVSEAGGADSYTIRRSVRIGTVLVALSTDGQCNVDPTSIVFSLSNYGVDYIIDVTPVDDAIVEGNHTCAISYNTGNILEGIRDTIVTVLDNDVAGFTILENGGSTDVTEGGATDSFTLQLDSTPSAAVQIAVTTDAQCSAAPTPLTFTAANTAQTVMLTAADDAAVETSPHACVVSFAVTSTDTDYNGLAVAGFSADVTDNDTITPPVAGVTVTQSGGATAISEGGATDTLTIRLNSAPSASVSIDVATDGQCAAVPASLTFTATDYATDQTVTISAADDGVAETSPHACVISYTVTSTDADYNALVVGDTTADVTDFGTPPPPPTGGTVASLPPPPPIPLCEDHNFSEGGVVRTGIADNLRAAINCRMLYQNGAPTSWLGSDLYTSGAIGSEGVMALGVQQAIDIFSPSGLTYFNGGAVFCLRGDGYLIWLAASGVPRRAEIIGSYRVDEFPGFTCATLFEPGTLVLVSRLPEGVSAP